MHQLVEVSENCLRLGIPVVAYVRLVDQIAALRDISVSELSPLLEHNSLYNALFLRYLCALVSQVKQPVCVGALVSALITCTAEGVDLAICALAKDVPAKLFHSSANVVEIIGQTLSDVLSDPYAAFPQQKASALVCLLVDKKLVLQGPVLAQLSAKVSAIEQQSLESLTKTAANQIAPPKSNLVFCLSDKPNRLCKLLWLDKMVLQQSAQAPTLVNSLNTLYSHKEPLLARISELITVSLDCLSVCLLRQDSAYYTQTFRTWFVKSLPLVILHLVQSLPTNNLKHLECAIARPLQALSKSAKRLLKISDNGNIDDAMDEDILSSFHPSASDIRSDFLQECVWLKLVSEHTRDHITDSTVGSNSAINAPIAPPAHESVALEPCVRLLGSQVSLRHALDCASKENPESVPLDNSAITCLVKSLEDLSAAKQNYLACELTQLARQWAQNYDMRSLHRLCMALGFYVNALDCFFLHVTPAELVGPLVHAVDQWTLDDDDVNLQEAHADFASVFLLVSLTVHRYSLSLAQLGVDVDSLSAFCLVLQNMSAIPGTRLRAVSKPVPLDSLSPQSRHMIGEWITALFDAGGISDDLMRSFSIKDLICSVPTLFQQSMAACNKGVLGFDTLKEGLEYFLQPFLLSVHAVALRWLACYLWETPNPQLALQVLETLILPPTDGSAHDATMIHSMLMQVVAHDLYASLLQLHARSQSLGVDVSILLNTLKPLYVASAPRASFIDKGSRDLSVTKALTDNITALCFWLQDVPDKPTAAPPGFDALMLQRGIDLIGCTRVLQLLCDLVAHESQKSPSCALDVVSTLLVFCPGSSTSNALDGNMIAVLENPPAELLAHSVFPLIQTRVRELHKILPVIPVKKIPSPKSQQQQQQMPSTNAHPHFTTPQSGPSTQDGPLSSAQRPFLQSSDAANGLLDTNFHFDSMDDLLDIS